MIAVVLKKAWLARSKKLIGDDRAQLLGDRAEVRGSRGCPPARVRQREMLGILLDAEIRRLEQLLQQDDLRALVGGLARQALGARDVGVDVPVARHLGGGDRDPARLVRAAHARSLGAGSGLGRNGADRHLLVALPLLLRPAHMDGRDDHADATRSR